MFGVSSVAILVSVEALHPNGGPPLARYSLMRWMVDPALGLEQAEADEQALKEEMAAAEAAS